MNQILVCNNCGCALTKPIWIYDEREGRRKGKKGYERIPAPENSRLEPITRKMRFDDYWTPKDTALRLKEPFEHGPFKNLVVAVRPDSLTKSVWKNEHWKIGCCGVYPGNKANRICKCKNEIGIEFGDCYSPKLFLPFFDGTKWQNVKL